MDGERVLLYLFEIAKENYQWSIFAASAFTFLTVSGILLCNNSNENYEHVVNNLSAQHNIGCLALKIDKLNDELTLRLDLQNEEQASIRNIINELQNKQEKIEESLYSDE